MAVTINYKARVKKTKRKIDGLTRREDLVDVLVYTQRRLDEQEAERAARIPKPKKRHQTQG
jgi:hypothetical protein